MRLDARLSDLRVLVTGGGGFIGRHLCRRLCDEGSEVHATSPNQQQVAGSGPIWWQADMADLTTARSVLAAIRPTVVFHLAGSVGSDPRPRSGIADLPQPLDEHRLFSWRPLSSAVDVSF
jgi:nucleoside-diphosphate-sugar epimerase